MSDDPSNSPESILPPFERPPWLTVSNVAAVLALIVSVVSLNLQFRDYDELTVGVTRFLAFTTPEERPVSAVSFSISLANTGTRPAIVSQVRLVLPRSRDFADVKTIAWREIPSGDIELDPLLIPADSLQLRYALFTFDLEGLYLEPDGSLQMKLCAEVIDSSGRRIEQRFGDFVAEVKGGKITGHRPAEYEAFGLLPERLTTRTRERFICRGL